MGKFDGYMRTDPGAMFFLVLNQERMIPISWGFRLGELIATGLAHSLSDGGSPAIYNGYEKKLVNFERGIAKLTKEGESAL